MIKMEHNSRKFDGTLAYTVIDEAASKKKHQD
jgi:hypothetical protein